MVLRLLADPADGFFFFGGGGVLKRSGKRTTVEYLENRQGGGKNPKRAHIVTYMARGRKGTTGTEGDFC